MYSNAIDESAGTLLGVFSGDMAEAHYELSLQVMNRADGIAAARGLPFVYVCVVDKDVPRPPAVWRKRFSDANYGVKSERFYFAMVTTSMLMRGVFTAVNWVTAKREGQYYTVVGDVAEAQHWLQAQHGVSCPALAQLEMDARRNLSAAAPRPQRST